MVSFVTKQTITQANFNQFPPNFCAKHIFMGFNCLQNFAAKYSKTAEITLPS